MALEAAVFFAVMGLFRLLGLDAASAAGRLDRATDFRPPGAQQRARENLTAAFPEKCAAEIEAIIAAMWDNLGRTVAEYAHLDKFAPQQARARAITSVATTSVDAEVRRRHRARCSSPAISPIGR